MAAVLSEPVESGIPEAIWIDDVANYLKDNGIDQPNQLFVNLEESHRKYKFFEDNLSLKQSKLKQQVPDIRANLDIVRNLKKSKEAEQVMDNFFKVNDGVYLKSEIKPTDTVYLWLGANVMLEYGLDEAEELLTNNLTSATDQLKRIQEDLDFLRDQMTSTEVSMARTHNYDVTNKRNNDIKKVQKK